MQTIRSSRQHNLQKHSRKILQHDILMVLPICIRGVVNVKSSLIQMQSVSAKIMTAIQTVHETQILGTIQHIMKVPPIENFSRRDESDDADDRVQDHRQLYLVVHFLRGEPHPAVQVSFRANFVQFVLVTVWYNDWSLA